MLKRLTLLAAAVAAFAALAVPASASAAEWQFEGKGLAENAEVELTGPGQFTVGGGAAGAKGTLHATLQLTPGNTGHVTALVVTDCTGLGQLASFSCHATAENLTWDVHCNEDGSATITDIQLRNHYTPEGFVADTTLTGDIIATGEGGSLDHVTLSGSGTVSDPSGAPAAVTGTLEAATPGYSCA